MARKRHTAKEIVAKLRQVDVLMAQGGLRPFINGLRPFINLLGDCRFLKVCNDRFPMHGDGRARGRSCHVIDSIRSRRRLRCTNSSGISRGQTVSAATVAKLAKPHNVNRCCHQATGGPPGAIMGATR